MILFFDTTLQKDEVKVAFVYRADLPFLYTK